MAGHSKWKNIRVRKGAQDAKRGKMFTKMGREIIMATRSGGGDPNDNPRLRLAIRNARQINMPNDNIERAIKKGSGDVDGENYEEGTFEGYGPAGVAFFVETLTDNRNRTVPELRMVFSKRGGNLGETGCVGWMFEHKAVIHIEASDSDEDSLLEILLDAGIEDVLDEGDSLRVVGAPEAFEDMLKALEAAGIEPVSSGVSMLPITVVELSDVKQAQQALTLVEDLEDHDDVQKVYVNFAIPDDIMDAISAS